MKFDKIIKLTGEYPSDFKPSITIMEIQQHFDAHGFYDARMIGGSKSFYHKEHSGDLIVFNANVLMPDYGKVWYGDLNLTEDYLILKSIAESLNTTLYVLWEMDGRFGEESKPIDELLVKAIWDTTENKPDLAWFSDKSKAKYKEKQLKGNDV
jgi:hypothetical protein